MSIILFLGILKKENTNHSCSCKWHLNLETSYIPTPEYVWLNPVHISSRFLPLKKLNSWNDMSVSVFGISWFSRFFAVVVLKNRLPDRQTVYTLGRCTIFVGSEWREIISWILCVLQFCFTKQIGLCQNKWNVKKKTQMFITYWITDSVPTPAALRIGPRSHFHTTLQSGGM